MNLKSARSSARNTKYKQIRCNFQWLTILAFKCQPKWFQGKPSRLLSEAVYQPSDDKLMPVQLTQCIINASGKLCSFLCNNYFLSCIYSTLFFYISTSLVCVFVFLFLCCKTKTSWKYTSAKPFAAAGLHKLQLVKFYAPPNTVNIYVGLVALFYNITHDAFSFGSTHFRTNHFYVVQCFPTNRPTVTGLTGIFFKFFFICFVFVS